MAHGPAERSLLEGFTVFGLWWWTWCPYAWLGNTVRADRGLLRPAVMCAMAAMFVACLAIPEAFEDLPGGVDGPSALVVCHAIVRLLHLSVYFAAAGQDRRLRRQVLLSLVTSMVPTVTLVALGVVWGHPRQLPVWLLAVVYDLAIIFITSRRGGGWVVRSSAHFAERHAGVVMLALGESVVAIAVGVSQRPLSWSIVVASVLALCLAAGLWSTYFDRVAAHLEQALSAEQGQARARLGRDLFTYLHFPIVFGVILTALGVEQAMEH